MNVKGTLLSTKPFAAKLFWPVEAVRLKILYDHQVMLIPFECGFVLAVLAFGQRLSRECKGS